MGLKASPEGDKLLQWAPDGKAYQLVAGVDLPLLVHQFLIAKDWEPERVLHLYQHRKSVQNAMQVATEAATEAATGLYSFLVNSTLVEKSYTGHLSVSRHLRMTGQLTIDFWKAVLDDPESVDRIADRIAQGLFSAQYENAFLLYQKLSDYNPKRFKCLDPAEPMPPMPFPAEHGRSVFLEHLRLREACKASYEVLQILFNCEEIGWAMSVVDGESSALADQLFDWISFLDEKLSQYSVSDKFSCGYFFWT